MSIVLQVFGDIIEPTINIFSGFRSCKIIIIGMVSSSMAISLDSYQIGVKRFHSNLTMNIKVALQEIRSSPRLFPLVSMNVCKMFLTEVELQTDSPAFPSMEPCCQRG